MNHDTDLSGRTAIVTGAGSGLGRAEALRLAELGANVVVNDLGDGANAVADEIRALGPGAVAVQSDISAWKTGDELVDAAVDTFGGLDIVVNNAGIVRDTMIFNLTEDKWDKVIDVHLKGHAALCHAAGVHFRAASKAAGGPIFGRIVNTASEAALMGAAGQPNYSAAKAGIIGLTLSTAQGLGRYGVKANAIMPRARTGMTEAVFAADSDSQRLDILATERVERLVGYLSGPAAEAVSSEVFIVYGDFVALLKPAEVEEKFVARTGVFDEAELAEQIGGHFQAKAPGSGFAAYHLAELDETGIENIA